ncbi:restriction endonuclease subunit S, partial [Rhizobium sp. KAs_5_22]
RRHKPALEQLAPKSAQRNINLETLRPLVIALPKPAEQERIATAYEAADERQISNEQSLRKLRHLKTALMQDLLTGKVRVTPLL